MPPAPLSDRRQAHAREPVEAPRPRVEQLLQDAAAQLAAPADVPFGAKEFALRDLPPRAGADLLEHSPRKKKNGYEGASVTCPHCPHAAPFHSHRPRTFVGLLGPVTVRRAYYRRGRRGRGRSLSTSAPAPPDAA